MTPILLIVGVICFLIGRNLPAIGIPLAVLFFALAVVL